MAYRLILDDSGTRDYDDARNYETSGKSRYFVYGALLIEDREAQLFITRLHELKQITFKTREVEIKSNWLRIPKEQRRRYLDPYGISEADLKKFTDGFYALIEGAQLQLIGSIVDKLHMQEIYAPPRAPWYAPTVAYEILLQRAVQAVPDGNSIAVTVDKISGRTSSSNDYEDLLQAHHAKLCKYGSKLQPALSFKPMMAPVRFTDSKHSDLIQVADVAAYNLFRQFRDHGEAWEKAVVGPLPTYEHFKRIAGKFYQGPGNRIQGFGVVKFPLIRRVIWSVSKNESND